MSKLLFRSVKKIMIKAKLKDFPNAGNAKRLWAFRRHDIAVLILSFIAVVTFLLSPYLINLIARGFSSEARELTVIITRVLLILVITMPLATIMSCRLNAHNRFALPALGKSFNFAFIIVFLTLLNNS